MDGDLRFDSIYAYPLTPPNVFRIQNGERLKEWALLLQRESPYRDNRIAVGLFIIPFRDKLAQDSQITGLEMQKDFASNGLLAQ